MPRVRAYQRRKTTPSEEERAAKVFVIQNQQPELIPPRRPTVVEQLKTTFAVPKKKVKVKVKTPADELADNADRLADTLEALEDG